MDADVIVIGSGFGGSVCAARAAQAGMRVLVLERGRWMNDTAYARMALGELPLRCGRVRDGLIDAQCHAGVVTVGGSAIGGGSHVYTAVTTRPPSEIFNEAWPASLRGDRLRPYFDRVESVLQPRPLVALPPRTRRLHEIGRLLAASTVTLPILMDAASKEISNGEGSVMHPVRSQIVRWLRGGGYRKRTLDETYLTTARRAGAMLKAHCKVVGVSIQPGGYRVRVERCEEGACGNEEFDAPRVIVAAGTMNTLRLLLNARDRHGSLPRLSRRLGEHFYMNGDFGGALIGKKLLLDADDGPPVTAWIDHWASDRLFLMETGVWANGRAWTFGVMGFDDVAGRITLGRGNRLTHTRADRADDDFHAIRVQRLRQLAEAAEARLLIAPDLVTRRWPMTVHPMGGAAVSDDPSRGVTNPYGEAWGYPGLFIADGSLLPTPTGVPPSMTIAALAERVADKITGHA